jgi:hypothetical protein
MPIHATIRLQHCTTNTRLAYVPKDYHTHGIARGAIHTYVASGPSWTSIRRMLRQLKVMGHSSICQATVDHWYADDDCGVVFPPRLVQVKE